MAKFVPIMVSLLIVGAFALALFTGGIMLQAQNNAPVLLIGDTDNLAFYQSINDTLQSSYYNTQTAQGSFENSSIQTSGVVPYISSVGGIWKVIRNAPMDVYNLVITYSIARLFGDSVALTVVLVIGAILTIVIISAVILLTSRGEGG